MSQRPLALKVCRYVPVRNSRSAKIFAPYRCVCEYFAVACLVGSEVVDIAQLADQPDLLVTAVPDLKHVAAAAELGAVVVTFHRASDAKLAAFEHSNQLVHTIPDPSLPTRSTPPCHLMIDLFPQYLAVVVFLLVAV